MATNADIFNEVISERNKSLIKEAFERKSKLELFSQVEKELPSLVRSYVKQQTKNIRTLSPKEVSELIDAAISSIPKPKAERVIEKTEVIKVVPKKDSVKYAQQSEIDVLKEQIKKLRKLIEEKDKEIAVQYIGTMIPNFNGQEGKALIVQNGQLAWGEAGSSGIPETYTMSNVTTRRTMDANDTSLDELADLVATLIQDLQSIGFVP